MLERVVLGGNDDGRERELFVQELVHGNPDILPMETIEPAFMPLLPVCMELPTSAGYVDNLWITPAGGIVLGECKLVRNPQARREVVVQALDYARAISGWHYPDLEAAISKAQRRAGGGLWEIVKDQTQLDEGQFADSVERRLRHGRFLILVIGDGIQEGVEQLTDYLQLHAGLHASLALVDLSIWRDGDGRRLVVPRVPMKTVLVERGIVTVAGDGRIAIQPAPASPRQGAGASRPARAVSASEPEYFERLEQSDPGLSALLRQVIARLGDIGVEPEFGSSIILRFFPTPNYAGSAGRLEADARADFSDVMGTARKIGRTEAGQAYLQGIAALLGGRISDTQKFPTVLDASGKRVRTRDLLGRQDAWLRLVEAFVTALRQDE